MVRQLPRLVRQWGGHCLRSGRHTLFVRRFARLEPSGVVVVEEPSAGWVVGHEVVVDELEVDAGCHLVSEVGAGSSVQSETGSSVVA